MADTLRIQVASKQSFSRSNTKVILLNIYLLLPWLSMPEAPSRQLHSNLPCLLAIITCKFANQNGKSHQQIKTLILLHPPPLTIFQLFPHHPHIPSKLSGTRLGQTKLQKIGFRNIRNYRIWIPSISMFFLNIKNHMIPEDKVKFFLDIKIHGGKICSTTG